MRGLRVKETRWPEIARPVNPAVQTRHDSAAFHLKKQEANAAFHQHSKSRLI